MYNRIRNLLEQVLLEFDPKKEKIKLGRGISNQSNAATRAEIGAMKSLKRKITFRDLPKIKKVSNRALARGGAGDKSSVPKAGRKLSGPKGRLPK